jgi:uncharacterized Fe-S cluster-containing radical SAM superfamily protein
VHGKIIIPVSLSLCNTNGSSLCFDIHFAEDVTSRSAKLIRTELQSSDNQSIQTSDLKLLQLAIYRERRRELPPLPKSRDEVHGAIPSVFRVALQDLLEHLHDSLPFFRVLWKRYLKSSDIKHLFPRFVSVILNSMSYVLHI